jgi:hypothetical protein
VSTVSTPSRPLEERGGAAVRWALAFIGLAAALTITVWQSSVHLAPAEAGLQERIAVSHGDAVLGPWLFWDAGYHADIADHGYTDADVAVFKAGGEAHVAFFPGYPLVVRAIAALVGDIGLAEVLSTFLAGLALAVVLHRWYSSRLAPAGARCATLATFLFPWAFFFVGAGYGDAMFVLCAVGAFALLEDDRPMAAGALGAIASGTRFVGVAVILGLVVRAAERRGALRIDGWRPRLDRSKLRPADHGVLLAGSGLLAYVAFCWVRYGDPLAFSTAQRGWNQDAGPRTWFKLTLIDQVLHNPDQFFVLRLVAQGAVALVFCAAVPAVWRRFGAGYGIYTTVALALPVIGSAAFASQGRYVLAAFPVFALLGEWLARVPRPRMIGYLATSGATLLLMTSWWGRGYWMG